MDFNKVMTWGGNIFLVLSMAIAGLLGADKLGVRLFPTGKDTGFQSKQVADTQGNKQLQLWLSEGDASCVVNLKIKNVQANDRFTARTKGISTRRLRRWWWTRPTTVGSISTRTSKRAPFTRRPIQFVPA